MKRDELERYACGLYTGCPTGCGEETCSYCAVLVGDDIISKLMERVDQYLDAVLVDLNDAGQELWTADEVASFLGLLDAHGARARLSQMKIRAARIAMHPDTGRSMSLYPADQVRAYREARRAARR